MSQFDQMFQEAAGPLYVEHLGEVVVFDPGVGPKRSVRAKIDRDMPSDFVDEVGAAVYRTVLTVAVGASSIDDNGRGGIDATEIVLNRAKFEFPLRTGSSHNSVRMVQRVADDGSGMLSLEVA